MRKGFCKTLLFSYVWAIIFIESIQMSFVSLSNGFYSNVKHLKVANKTLSIPTGWYCITDLFPLSTSFFYFKTVGVFVYYYYLFIFIFLGGELLSLACNLLLVNTRAWELTVKNVTKLMPIYEFKLNSRLTACGWFWWNWMNLATLSMGKCLFWRRIDDRMLNFLLINKGELLFSSNWLSRVLN